MIARSEVERIQKMQDDIFLKGCIPWWVGVGGYVIFAILAIVVIPFLYTPVRWCAAFLLPNPDSPCFNIIWQPSCHTPLVPVGSVSWNPFKPC